jgi:GWxTD domain-containing protein
MPSEDPRAEPQIFSTPGEPGAAPAPPPGRRRELVSLSALLSARLLRLRPRRGPRITGQIERDGLEIPRWGILLGILLTLLLFLAMLALLFGPDEAHAAADSGINFDRPTKDWYAGPVRYIISKQEVKAYKSLETELDRQNFIDWFWQRRDVVPATPQNEFRDRFEQRVFDANRMFSDTAKPGWKTDQGKVYVLVGPPDEINRDVMAKTHRGIITWVYRRPPFPDLQPNTVVAFARDHSGEFVLSESPTLDSDVARGLQFARVKRTAEDRLVLPGRADPALLAAGVPVSQGTLATMLITGRLQQLPPHEEEMFKDFVHTREFFGTIPAESRFDFYRASDGTTYTALTIGIRSTAVQYASARGGGREKPEVVVFGKLVNKDRPDEVYPLAGDSAFAESVGNASAGPEDLLIFQASGGFKPGKYQLVLGVQDKVAKKISAYRRDVEIPDLGGAGLRLSSITLAGDMEPTDYAPTAAKPFFLGKFRVEPRPDNGFRRSDELNVYFQIYDPATDPATGRPRLDVYYSFKQRAADGSLTDVGTYGVKDAAAQVQGYAVPLEQWPAGDYLITIQVVDKVSGAVASADAAFVVRED